MDERAKMSVAAKRSLFRVSALCSIHNLSNMKYHLKLTATILNIFVYIF